ncbi:MAG: hypothetical protein JW809_14210 [Pirellulales bacterium]|nr:hypothetical protein [Pirellulales bacterium]
MKTRVYLAATIVAVVLLCGVLGLYKRSEAAPPPPAQRLPPFAETVQRQMDVIAKLDEVVAQMKEQNKLLKEQIAILKSGKLEVVIKK